MGTPQAGRVILDPRQCGAGLAAFFFSVEGALWSDLEGSGALPSPVPARARREWECFALYACVRGLVAAGGFGPETSAAVDHLHELALERWALEPTPPEPLEARTRRIADRYAEFGRIGQESEAAGPASVKARLGETAALHMCAPEPAPADLAAMVAELHEAMAEGAAEVVKRAEV